MEIYDWIVLAIVGALVVRGWVRGAVREALDVALLLFGSLLVFRMAPAVGTVISGMANIPYEVARVVAGLLLFGVLVVGSILVGKFIASAAHIIPGASTLNRFLGASIGFVYAAIVVVLATTLIAATPLPAAAATSVETSIGGSAIGSYVAEPNGLVGKSLSVLSGQEILRSVIAVRQAVGERLMAGTIPIPLPPVDDEVLSPSQADAQDVFDTLNRERLSEGLAPLAWSSDLAVVAVARATDVYRSGFLSLDGELSKALEAAGIPGTIHADMVVIGASTDGVVEAIVTTTDYRLLAVDPAFRKSGVGVVQGPYGLIAVQVLSA